MSKQKSEGVRRLEKELQKHRRLAGKLFEALMVYADPEFYHAISFLGDHPCGEFLTDFGKVDSYDRPMPGKSARKTIKRVAKLYPDLKIITTAGPEE